MQYCLADILAFKQAPGKPRKSYNVDIAELVQGKIEEFDVKGAVRIISSNDKLAEQTPEVIQEMRAKHPSGEEPRTVPSEAEPARTNPNSVRKKICSFPAGSAGGPDRLRPQVLKDLIAPSNGDAGTRLLHALTDFTNTVLAGLAPHVSVHSFLEPTCSHCLRKLVVFGP